MKLHLRPLASSDQRAWVIGGDAGIPSDSASPLVVLRVTGSQLGPFSALAELRAQIDQMGIKTPAWPLDITLDSHVLTSGDSTRFWADSVTLAVLRRISRESVYTAASIDSAAQWLNAAFASSRSGTIVEVAGLEHADRVTLKVLARAMLLLPRESPFGWRWHFRRFTNETPEERARSDLLGQLVEILDPQADVREEAAPRIRARHDGTLLDAAVALVLQDYETCFRITSTMNDRHAALRMRAIAAVNLGWFDEALAYLCEAEESSQDGSVCAHLCYLQGLVHAKRRYSLDQSDACYVRGLNALTRHSSGSADPGLERAWLLNGQALNLVLRWRRDQRIGLDPSFRKIREAFSFVKVGDNPSRTYLRFNLLANLAFLLELSGRVDLAINTLRETFTSVWRDADAEQSRWHQTTGYRIGILHLRAGQLAEARTWLERALDPRLTGKQTWFMRERVLRGAIAAAAACGAWETAIDGAKEALHLSRLGRSADGARWHGAALTLLLQTIGRKRDADDLIEQLLAEEQVEIDPGVMPPPAPKLPAYIPEIDLEQTPSIDLNRYLARATDRRSEREWSN